MRTKQCTACGLVFQAAHNWNTLCPSCAKSSKAGTVIRDRTCRQCGNVFPGGPRAWYCPDCRLERTRERDRAHKRSGPARPLGSIDHCTQCGSEYVVTAGRQRYCPACKDSATAAAVRPVKREYAKAYAPKRDAAREAAKHHKVCVICGSLIDISSPTVTCSDACALEYKRRQQKKFDQKRKKQ